MVFWRLLHCAYFGVYVQERNSEAFENEGLCLVAIRASFSFVSLSWDPF